MLMVLLSACAWGDWCRYARVGAVFGLLFLDDAGRVAGVWSGPTEIKQFINPCIRPFNSPHLLDWIALD